MCWERRALFPLLPHSASFLQQQKFFDYHAIPFLGTAYAPFGTSGEARKNMTLQTNVDRLEDRGALRRGLDRLRREIDTSGNMSRVERFSQQALDLVASGKIHPVVSQVVPPERIEDVHRALREGTLVGRGAVDWNL